MLLPGIVHGRTRGGVYEPLLLLGWEGTDCRVTANDDNILNYFGGNARWSRWQYRVNLRCKVERFRVASIEQESLPFLS